MRGAVVLAVVVIGVLMSGVAPAGATGPPDFPNKYAPSSFVQANVPYSMFAAGGGDRYSAKSVTPQMGAPNGNWVARSVFAMPRNGTLCVRVQATTDVVIRINPGALRDMINDGHPTTRVGNKLCWKHLNGNHERQIRVDYSGTGFTDSFRITAVTGRMTTKRGDVWVHRNYKP